MGAFDDLIAVSDLDVSIDQRRHRLETHPACAAVAAVEADLAELARQAADIERERAAVVTEQTRLEAEVGTFEAKATQVHGQLYGGAVTSPKELEALQHELDTLRKLQRTVEDRVIEQMELLEPLDGRLSELADRRREREEALSAAQAELSAALADIEAELEELNGRRSKLAAGVDPGLLAEYERIRRRSGGVGAARLVGGRCEGCHLSLPAVEVDRIRRLPPEEIVTCPECGRLLVRST